jgi:tetratricopeptide (TPR) repeat protein
MLAIAVCAVFASSLQNDFTNWDDGVYVFENPNIRHVDLRGLIQIFHPKTLTAQDWTPLVTFTHAIEYQLFALEPLPYHATNVLLHMGATLAVFALMLRVGVPYGVAFAGALIFGIHPLQVESVVWISGRKNLMSALFGFLTILAYLRGTRRAYQLSLLLFVLSCLSKGIAMVVPPLLVASLLFGSTEIRWRRESLRLLPFFLFAAARGLMTVDSQAEVWARTLLFPLDQRMGIMGGVLLSYLRQFFVPIELRAFYGWRLITLTDPLALAGWGVVLGLSVLVFLWARRTRWIGYLGLFIPITIFPMLNIFPAPFLQADRYVYMSLPAAGALVAAALYALAERLRRPWLAPVLLAGWCGVVLTAGTLRQIPVWKDSYTLWNYTLEYEPTWHIAYNNLGLWYFNHDDIEEAISLYEQTLAIRPGFYEAKVNLAFAFYKSDRYAEAEVIYRGLMEGYPDGSRLYHGLAQVLQKREEFGEAEAMYRTALDIEPINPEALTNLGALLYDQARFAEALLYYDKAVRQDPLAAAAHNNRGNVLRRLGRLDAGAASLRRAIELDPEYPAAYSNLGAVLVDAGKPFEALPNLQKALDMDPELASAASNLGNAYFAVGRMVEALAAYDRALEIDPDLAEALSNSGNAHSLLGQPEEAQRRYRRALELRENFPEAKYGLGRSLLVTGHPKEALPLLLEASEGMPNFVEAAASVAHAAWQRGQLQLAAKSFGRVIRLEPGRIPAYQNLAQVLVALDRHKDAEVVLREAVNRLEHPALLDQLAAVLDNGDPSRKEEVEKLRARAQELRPDGGQQKPTTQWTGKASPDR